MLFLDLERGSSREFLHWQGLIITDSPMHPSDLNMKLKEALGWLRDVEGKTHIHIKALTHNNDLHTSLGMLGDRSKNLGKDHYDKIRKGVTDEIIKRGKEIYAVVGDWDFKQNVCLTKDNIFEKAYIIWLYSKSIQRYYTLLFTTVLQKMTESGN